MENRPKSHQAVEVVKSTKKNSNKNLLQVLWFSMFWLKNKSQLCFDPRSIVRIKGKLVDLLQPRFLASAIPAPNSVAGKDKSKGRLAASPLGFLRELGIW